MIPVAYSSLPLHVISYMHFHVFKCKLFGACKMNGHCVKYGCSTCVLCVCNAAIPLACTVPCNKRARSSQFTYMYCTLLYKRSWKKQSFIFVEFMHYNGTPFTMILFCFILQFSFPSTHSRMARDLKLSSLRF